MHGIFYYIIMKKYMCAYTRARVRVYRRKFALKIRQEHLKAAIPIIRPHISGGKSHRFTALRFVNRLYLLKGGSLSTALLSFRPSEAVSRARGEISERQRRTKGCDRAMRSDFSTTLEMTGQRKATVRFWRFGSLFCHFDQARLKAERVEKSRSAGDGQKGATAPYS